MIRIGIIGCGKIAQVRHLPEYAANPHVELAGYYDLNTQRAQEMAAQYGGKVYDSGYASFMSSPYGTTVGTNYHKDILKAWTPENKGSDIPRLQYGDQYTTSVSDRFLTDASYLNISNINVGYTLPSKITQKFGVQKLRVYLACDNVVYWSKRQGLDPRYSFTGATNFSNYSPIRTISGGVTVQF